MRVSRKTFLRSAAAAGTCWSIGLGGMSAQVSEERARRERLARLLREYDAQGDHRTGTVVDAQSGRWLARRVRDAGLEPVLEAFGFSRIDIRAAYARTADRWIEGVPLFDGGFTGPAGLEGRLGPVGSDAPIGLARPGAALASARGEGRHRAIVVVTGQSESDAPGPLVFAAPEGLALANAARYLDPFGPPALQVPTQAERWLSDAVRAGATVRLVADVGRRDVKVFNVTAVLNGRRPDLQPVVVMTPRSGWWSCASERGGGIAMWLELMRELAARGSERTVHFVASTGHELGHLGLKQYLRQRAALIPGAAAWIHLGANLGAAVRGGGRDLLQVSDDAIRTVANDALARHRVEALEAGPPGARPIGEAIDIHEGGGRYVSVIGSSGLFHHPRDRWPSAVDIDAVDRMAGAFLDVAKALTR